MKDELIEKMMEVRLREMDVRDELCKYVREIQSRKIWKDLGYTSLQEFCEDEMGYDTLEARALLIASHIILISKNLVSADPECQARIERLKTWRREKSFSENITAFRVLSNRTLLAVAVQNPQNLEDLSQVRGIGERKMDLFGEKILELMKPVGVGDSATPTDFLTH